MADENATEGSSSVRGPSSLSRLWRKGKEKWQGRDATGTGPASGAVKPDLPSEEDKTRKEKAQIRRAQVRRAQIQHRQRKANYVKSLELDVTQYRDMIKQAQIEAVGLSKENEAIKTQLRLAGIEIPNEEGLPKPPLETSFPLDPMVLDGGQDHSPQAPLQAQAREQALPRSSPPLGKGELFGSVNVSELTVSLSMDDTMGTPVFTISPSSSSDSLQNTRSPSWLPGHTEMTELQEHCAINFILALEHVCWDHFWEGDFWHHGHTTEQDKNHTLLASAYAMASAPESAYTERQVFKQRKVPYAAAVQWQSSGAGINLDALRGLALSLNPSDKEVAPVQAWFELVDRYSLDRLTEARTLEALKGEFKGVVKCVAFGAAVERSAFQSVVTRVLGAPLVPWTTVAA